MAGAPIRIDDFERMSIDPETGRLFWDGQEVLTTLSLPPSVNGAIIATAVIAGLGLAWSVAKFFLERRDRLGK